MKLFDALTKIGFIKNAGDKAKQTRKPDPSASRFTPEASSQAPKPKAVSGGTTPMSQRQLPGVFAPSTDGLKPLAAAKNTAGSVGAAVGASGEGSVAPRPAVPNPLPQRPADPPMRSVVTSPIKQGSYIWDMEKEAWSFRGMGESVDNGISSVGRGIRSGINGVGRAVASLPGRAVDAFASTPMGAAPVAMGKALYKGLGSLVNRENMADTGIRNSAPVMGGPKQFDFSKMAPGGGARGDPKLKEMGDPMKRINPFISMMDSAKAGIAGAQAGSYMPKQGSYARDIGLILAEMEKEAAWSWGGLGRGLGAVADVGLRGINSGLGQAAVRGVVGGAHTLYNKGSNLYNSVLGAVGNPIKETYAGFRQGIGSPADTTRKPPVAGDKSRADRLSNPAFMPGTGTPKPVAPKPAAQSTAQSGARGPQPSPEAQRVNPANLPTQTKASPGAGFQNAQNAQNTFGMGAKGW